MSYITTLLGTDSQGSEPQPCHFPGTLGNSQITTEFLLCVERAVMLSAEGCVGWGGGKQNYCESIWIVLVAQIQVWNPYLLEFGGERTQNLAASICPDVGLLHVPLVLEKEGT